MNNIHNIILVGFFFYKHCDIYLFPIICKEKNTKKIVKLNLQKSYFNC